MQETYNDIWRKMEGRVRLHLIADSFQRWFAAIELVQADEIALTFKVPNSIYHCKSLAFRSLHFLCTAPSLPTVSTGPKEQSKRAPFHDHAWSGAS